MSGVAVRSEALLAAAAAVDAVAEDLREQAQRVCRGVAAVGPPRLPWPEVLTAARLWVRVETAALAAAGPGGAWGESWSLDALAVHLRCAARAYEEVERVVTAVMAGVDAGADLAARGGWLTDGPGASAVVVATPPGGTTAEGPGVGRTAWLVACGEGLDGGRVRVLETTRADGGAAWVVVVPGTQEWSPRAGVNPFDATTDVRAMTGAATVAAAGVAAALVHARASSGRSTSADPVLLVGHSQGGILAAALASDPTFTADHRVTHVVTTGAPVALFPVPESLRVLSVEHTDDPVPRLDLTPNPDRSGWVTVQAARGPTPVDLSSHRRDGYVETLTAAEAAPAGTVPGLDAWRATAAPFLHAPIRAISEFQVRRG